MRKSNSEKSAANTMGCLLLSSGVHSADHEGDINNGRMVEMLAMIGGFGAGPGNLVCALST